MLSGGNTVQFSKERFQKTEVLELVPAITYSQLDYWAKTGLVEPSIQKARGHGSRRIYGWVDLVALQTVAELLEAGASVRRIRKAARALKRFGKKHPLTECLLAVSADGKIYEVLERDKIGALLTKHPGQTFWISPVGDFAQDIGKRMAQKSQQHSEVAIGAG